ncbi:hypothetical protein B0919_05675 [Hymenobacter sp. CRA2]|nr:hypothetical protein B0919_05675 [Hymenobacter sp. CRA2]
MPVYSLRAEARQYRGALVDAEADLTQALRYAERFYPYMSSSNGFFEKLPAEFLRDAYYQRALLRLEHLHNPAGGCADMATSYQLDTVRTSSPRWRDCKLPGSRAPLNTIELSAAKARWRDSLTRVPLLLQAGRLARADYLLQQLAAGQVGPYVRVPPLDEGPVNLTYLRSEVARRRGQYARARAYLDTLLALPNPAPLHRYALGILKIDHLNDRAGGCEDLRWVYTHDTTSTAPTHPRWRGCPMPAYRVAATPAELGAYATAYMDSVNHARELTNSGQMAQAVQILSRLLHARVAGAYIQHPLAGYSSSPYPPDNPYHNLRAATFTARAQAYVQQQEYRRAVADLDTLIEQHHWSRTLTTEAYCQRGRYRLDYLHDERGCDDLYRCFERQGQPVGPDPWRGCPQAGWARQKNRAASESNVTFRLGGLAQGKIGGVEVGFQQHDGGTGEWGFNHGPSLELEALAKPLIVAPKFSYEVEYYVIGGRLDFAAYIPLGGPKRAVDLRVIPQAGASLLGVVNVFYGYALPLTHSPLDVLGRHRVSVFINFLKLTKFGG